MRCYFSFRFFLLSYSIPNFFSGFHDHLLQSIQLAVRHGPCIHRTMYIVHVGWKIVQQPTVIAIYPQHFATTRLMLIR